MTQEADNILERAAQPRSASGDSGSASSHSIPDQIAAKQFQAASSSFGTGLGGIRRIRMRPGHPTGLRVGRYEDRNL